MNYSCGQPDGICEVYYRNGKLKSETLFDSGEITSVKEYSESGALTKRIIYTNGVATDYKYIL